MTVVGALDPRVEERAATPAAGGHGLRWRIWGAIALIVIASLAAIPWWGPRVLARLDFFHVRHVEFEGVLYARTDELLAKLSMDTTQSIWQPLEPIQRAILTHPLVASATVDRRLPGTLRVTIVERTPVAMVPVNGVLTPTDVSGHRLPIDKLRTPIDVPVVTTADRPLLEVLDVLRRDAPDMFARVVSARRAGEDHLVFDLGSVLVRTRDDVTVARFRDILPVEADLAREGLRVVELDLRFRNQVIARQP